MDISFTVFLEYHFGIHWEPLTVILSLMWINFMEFHETFCRHL